MKYIKDNKTPVIVCDVQEDAGKRVIGDTYLFVKELFDVGCEFHEYTGEWQIIPGVSDMFKLNELQSNASTKPLDPCFKLYVTKKRKFYHLTGNTYPHRNSIRLRGGIYDGKTKTWRLKIDEWADFLIEELQKKCEEQQLKYERGVHQRYQRKQSYKKFLADNETELARVTELAFAADPDRWWPISVKDPKCYRCGYHLVWHYYLEFDKSDERIKTEGRGLVCPSCGCDFTN